MASFLRLTKKKASATMRPRKTMAPTTPPTTAGRLTPRRSADVAGLCVASVDVLAVECEEVVAVGKCVDMVELAPCVVVAGVVVAVGSGAGDTGNKGAITEAALLTPRT